MFPSATREIATESAFATLLFVCISCMCEDCASSFPTLFVTRLVQGYRFAKPTVDAPVSEVCADGGKVRLRTPVGEASIWRDYKAMTTTSAAIASLHDNHGLIEWVNTQSLAAPVVGLGDGDDGVWNIIAQIATPQQRCEILAWYDLVENLHKVGGSIKRLRQAEALLWQGNVDDTLALFTSLKGKQAQNFCQSLQKYCPCIVNYAYYQTEGIYSIGSGAVEFATQQIDRRVQISGAQWKTENVPQVLAHRTAYLNG